MKPYYVVIPAAGYGSRMKAGKNKQFITIEGVPLLIHTLRVFQEDSLCEGIVLAVNEAERDEMRKMTADAGITKVIGIVPGGRERQQSVFEGLKALSGNPVVLIHDGARPFIRTETLRRLIEAVDKDVGAVAGVPVKDTVKEAIMGSVKKTLDRSLLWLIQTPQAFYLEDIRSAHKLAEDDNHPATDDASLFEYAGKTVKVVEGTYENIKVTTPEDLMFAEAIIRKREEER
ncbi:2-C-methyl-D-erythritol 4-phosphate cytidylyltransferase [Salisediminibacterium halotolerans]|uniref:2-C-methyl-D-erythritol 4-phosphate cytidylyltransferase n=1 Tax=Salisediminibacterium halotolerans TaxID=517425 RepID=UPI000EAC2A93|nr:2-C-methyl-D-erythritol 4-phosphate cytidylyltransferase [Salisediminibacterium halotolerans]RLJ73051.1 2-C-methyl-D-erythritol 4-phosphate cytidylyltransferase [Actinophytocola xinjiangensis]RPE86473.1 2-C-methyl-D-erythritol 4-phosphate cytidylyltransferase [Salisediminibacterium halotolerans]TWG33848.1 2-C-methyl-D-erythritol 4-phosphate cytidylyltransferase [Salisediminibacterium halotolerans]GEL08368.1 2-C-methyl-D-erythritol 4-phosphate cytidylyltransferase [Salisediminibacterium halot